MTESFSESMYGRPVLSTPPAAPPAGMPETGKSCCEIAMYIILGVLCIAIFVGVIRMCRGDATLSTLTCAGRLGKDEISNVSHATCDADVDAAVKANKKTILMFYANWCGHCKAMKPIVDRVAAAQTDIPFVFVDGDQISPKCHGDYQVDGYPTVIAVSNGKRQAFEGERSFEKLSSWCKSA